MTEAAAPGDLDRAELVTLLETLGSANDEEALAAARSLASKVAAAGTSWDALLADDEPELAEDDGEDAAGAAIAALPADEAAKRAETLALIDKMLARSGHSDDFRQELEDYKEELAAGEDGEFGDSDHAYIRALYKRLAG